MVRKFVISEDGSVDVGVAQFVKWAMRIFASTFIVQGTSDPLFAWVTLVSSWIICSSITRLLNSGGWSPQWRRNKEFPRHKRAEFLRRFPKTSPQGKFMRSPRSAPSWWSFPLRGLTPPTTRNWRASRPQRDHYSTFHRMPRRRMSKKEWDELTRQSTEEAMTELVSTLEFAEWIIENADGIQIRPEDGSDDAVGNGLDFTDEAWISQMRLLLRMALAWDFSTDSVTCDIRPVLC